jgi:hypothetical protein
MSTAPIGGGAPPKNVAPEALWTRLTAMPRPTKLVDFPRRDPTTGSFLPEQVAVVVLTTGEQQKARAAAEQYAIAMLSGNPDSMPFNKVVDVVGGRSLGYEEIYRNELAIETVCLAFRDPKDVRQMAFPNSQLARAFLTQDEITALFMAYLTHQSESGPLVSSMDVPTMNAWIEKLREGASRLPLSVLSLAGLQDLVMHLVSLLPTSPTDSGSAGSPPDGSSPDIASSLPSDAERPAPPTPDA